MFSRNNDWFRYEKVGFILPCMCMTCWQHAQKFDQIKTFNCILIYTTGIYRVSI